MSGDNMYTKLSFFGNGTEYEYWIKASDGAVVKKELELKDDRKQPETKMITQTAETKPAGDIGVEKAKENCFESCSRYPR